MSRPAPFVACAALSLLLCACNQSVAVHTSPIPMAHAAVRSSAAMSRASVAVSSTSSRSSRAPIVLRDRLTMPIPILMYHYIVDPALAKDKAGQDLSVGPVTFGKQLDWLKDNGYETVTFADVRAGTLPAKPVILTFDDGYQDAYDNALPALHSRGMKGTFYIISGFVGKAGYMTWDELKTLRDSGMEIGAHTVHHLDLRKLDEKKQTAELLGSMNALEKELQIHIVSLAYPAGKYDDMSLSLLRGAHLPFAVTTHGGTADAASDPLLLPRIRMHEQSRLDLTLAKQK